MAPDEPSGPKPAPVVLRIKLRYDDVAAMVQRFAPNVGKSGLFLPTKSLQPVGAEVKFELRIADDTPVLVGLGRVKVAKPPDPAQPKAAFGMAIELMRVTRESREVILKMLERRKQMGLPELGIPMPADIDAARRSEVVDTQVRDTASAPIPAPAPTLDSGPSESLLTSPRRASGPIAIAKLDVVEALAPEPPRKKRPAVHEVIERASGPVVSVVSVPGLDDDVDVGAVLARARALAGGNLDAELEALREVAAVPLEVSIEAASAELARQLGGKAVNKKDRSARWEKPPDVVVEAKAEPASIVETPPPAPEPVVETKPAPEPEPVPVAQVVEAPVVTAVEAPTPAPTFTSAQPTFVDEEDSGPIHVAPQTPAEIQTDPANAPLIHDGVDPAAFEERENSAREVEPDQIADEIHQLGEEDFEEVEHTQIGAMPEEPSFEQQAFTTEPAVAAELERSLDAHLAEAEAEADRDDLGISGAYRLPQAPIVDDPADDVPPEAEAGTEHAEQLEEIDDFEILAEADAEDADLLSAHGEADVSGSREVVAPPPAAQDPEPEPEPRHSHSDFVSRLDLSDEFEAAPEAEPEASQRPFSGRHASFSELDARLGELDPQSVSAGHALAAFEEEPEPEPQPALQPRGRYDQLGNPDVPFDEPVSYHDGPTGNPDDVDADSQYTLAGNLPPPDAIFDAPHTGFKGHRAYEEPDDLYENPNPPGFSPPGQFDQSDVIQNVAPPRRAKPPSEPYQVRTSRPSRAPEPASAEDNYELESALEALDVDLDDLSVPHERPSAEPLPRPPTAGPRQRQSSRPPSQQRAQSRSSGSLKIPKRATTDDGVLIDFDDDE